MSDRLGAALSDRYRIERELGAGGMATVYLAQDLKHDRRVAIKVLKPDLAAVLGAERFIAEIKTTAALSHPHILPLFDSGEAGGFLYYVMPYIAGETIRDRLNRETQLGVEDAVRITAEVADALDYAHRHGVIHRDIKPENILLHDGRAMVMDFGIALAVSAAAGGRMTETGLSLGTPHYMSPEQATAEKELTARSDIYSLGTVLYEMLTGEPPHLGNSAQAIIMKIVTEDAQPVTRLRKAVPPNVAAAVAKALERLPADRFTTARAFAEALADPRFASGGERTVGAGAPGRRGVPVPLLAAIGVAITVLAGAAGWLARAPGDPPQRAEFRIPVPSRLVSGIDVSPDGSLIILRAGFEGSAQLRRVGRDSLEPVVTGIFRGHRFSPDGQSVLGTAQDQSLVVAPLGGPTRSLATVPVNQANAVWGWDGFIYFEAVGGLARVPAAGRAIDTLLVGDSLATRHVPQDALPDGQNLLLMVRGPGTATVALFDIERRTVTPLFSHHPNASVRYSRTGHLIYTDRNLLVARTLDIRRGRVGEELITLAEAPPAQSILFGVGAGTLALAPSGSGNQVLMIADRLGNTRPLPSLPEGSYSRPAVSPDGARIAMLRDANDGRSNAWVYDLPAGPLSPLTRSGGIQSVDWSRDGRHVGFVRGGAVFWRRADASEEEQLLLRRERPLSSVSFAPDNRIVFQESPGSWDIGVATIGVPGSDSLLLKADYWEGGPRVSPDGRWLAYYSTEGGPPQIFVQPFPGPGGRVQVSTRGATNAKWSSDSRTLYFHEERQLMEAILSPGPSPTVASVRPVFDFDGVGLSFDPFPGGGRFAVAVPADGGSTRTDVTVMVNFDLLLQSRPGVRRQ